MTDFYRGVLETKRRRRLGAKKRQRVMEEILYYYKLGLNGAIDRCDDVRELRDITGIPVKELRNGIRTIDDVYCNSDGWIISISLPQLELKSQYSLTEIVKLGRVEGNVFTPNGDITTLCADGIKKLHGKGFPMKTRDIILALKKVGSAVDRGLFIYFIIGRETFYIPRPKEGTENRIVVGSLTRPVYCMNVLTKEIIKYDSVAMTVRERKVPLSVITNILKGADNCVPPYYKISYTRRDLSPTLSKKDILTLGNVWVCNDLGHRKHTFPSVRVFYEWVLYNGYLPNKAKSMYVIDLITPLKHHGYIITMMIGDVDYTARLRSLV